jgi:hypothetical protein
MSNWPDTIALYGINQVKSYQSIVCICKSSPNNRRTTASTPKNIPQTST